MSAGGSEEVDRAIAVLLVTSSLVLCARGWVRGGRVVSQWCKIKIDSARWGARVVHTSSFVLAAL
jgi:hypothetical protein